jgi:tRNA pseudouridine32 synthase/23S rRNA pseudouridine746 synthase
MIHAGKTNLEKPDSLKSLIVYQDDAIIIIQKPAGIAVHSGRGGRENLEQYLQQLQFDYSHPPKPAHRLDCDTSGCLILGRSREALGSLGKMFMARRIGKTYWAVVQGRKIEKTSGIIEIPLRRQSTQKNKWWMEASPDGQKSITAYKVRGRDGDFTFLELYPKTGRTHQIRVHCKAIGCPIVGDKIYGNLDINQVLHLHARAVSIPRHNKSPILVTAPPPIHMLELLQKCGYNECDFTKTEFLE